MKRTKRLLIVALVAGVLAAVPGVVSAGGGFVDVPSDYVFRDDITWMADAGVTKGCNPPDNTEFCPSDNVTRAQMAAFMRRFAESDSVRVAQAADADRIGGRSLETVIPAIGRGDLSFGNVGVGTSPVTLASYFFGPSDVQFAVLSSFTGYINNTTVGATSSDHSFLCWFSPTELSSFDVANLPESSWVTYPVGSPGVFTLDGQQHSLPIALQDTTIVPAGATGEFFLQCQDLVGDGVEVFAVNGNLQVQAVPNDFAVDLLDASPAGTVEIPIVPAPGAETN